MKKSGNIFLIDVGNTSVTMGLWTGGRIARRSRLQTAACSAENIRRAVVKLAGRSQPDSAVYCSVVPSVNKRWLGELNRVVSGRTIVVTHKLKLGVKIRYPRPATIGADRLADACAVAWRHGVPAIVADFGTALTFDVISADGAYVGGAIAPGLSLMTDYLYEKTALLPRLRRLHPYSGIGRSTEEAMRVGAVVGYRGLIRETVQYLMHAMGAKKVTLCATGGNAAEALRGLDMKFIIEPDLTLYGLYRIWELNEREEAMQ